MTVEPLTHEDLSLFAATWLVEWRSLGNSVTVNKDELLVFERQWFPTGFLEKLELDDRYVPPLRLYSRDEIRGASKIMRRMADGTPGAWEAITQQVSEFPAGETEGGAKWA